jgi:hypothetical protein
LTHSATTVLPRKRVRILYAAFISPSFPFFLIKTWRLSSLYFGVVEIHVAMEPMLALLFYVVTMVYLHTARSQNRFVIVIEASIISPFYRYLL